LLAFSNISLQSVALLIIFRIGFFATNGLFLRAFAAKFDIRLSLKEWFGIPIVTAMGNYLTPFSGGTVARAAYLKYRHDFPYAKFVTLLASNYLVSFWVIGVVGFIASLNLVDLSQSSWQLSFLFLVIVAGISILILLPSFRLPWRNRLTNIVNISLEGWTLVKDDKLLLFKLVIFTLMNIFLNGFSFWVAYHALGFSVSLIAATLIGLLAAFSVLLNITPGNLGIQEAVISMSSALLGAGTSEGLMVALLVRASTLMVVFTLGPLYSYILTKNLIADSPKGNPTAQTSIGEDIK
jgi:uncharacterized membrane protein YbhN (UPF0104 family)